LRRLSAIFLFLLFPATLFLAGCVISPRRTLGGGGTSGNGVGHLYVSDQSAGAILTFAGATGDTGNSAPTANISGGSTLLSNPQYIFSDSANDRLYVANLGGSNILVFNAVSTLSGSVNSAPARAISSANLSAPTDVALDTSKDLLYVADTGVVVVFASAATANGTLPAAAVLQLGFTPTAILVDSSNDRLFVANGASNAVHIFDNASTLNGSVTAPRILSGPNHTGLNQPSGLRIDGAGRLIVSNTGGVGINIYANAATVSGDISPVTVIAGSNTTLSAPAQIALDLTTNSGELYVADPTAGEVVVFSSITTATGTINATPNRSINGSSTLLTGTGNVTARGVAIDTSH
jgi:sugar lactone lactonase YvrE